MFKSRPVLCVRLPLTYPAVRIAHHSADPSPSLRLRCIGPVEAGLCGLADQNSEDACEVLRPRDEVCLVLRRSITKQAPPSRQHVQRRPDDNAAWPRYRTIKLIMRTALVGTSHPPIGATLIVLHHQAMLVHTRTKSVSTIWQLPMRTSPGNLSATLRNCPGSG